MDLIGSMSGKICGHSDISFAKKGKTQYTMKRCNKRSTPYSQEELARQAKFAQVRAAMKALSEEQKAEYAAQFKNPLASIPPSTATSSPRSMRSWCKPT